MNVTLAASSLILAANTEREATSLDIRFDLISGFFLLLALVIGALVYQWTAPAPTATHQNSKGERLMYAVVSAAAVIAIGTYFGDGFGGIERVEKTSSEKKHAAAVQLVLTEHPDQQRNVEHGTPNLPR
ncbi:hypothetical protein ACF09E_35500 [Streptomyces sp. NPDC014891]|uniref:hypothetical protein n=1 Tax=Streptomyces sp. NPDC014891 TaxID=3364929 RepID=UPI0036F917E0